MSFFDAKHLPKIFSVKFPIDALGEVPVFIAIGILVTTAVFLGGLVGYDRERKHKSAGIKTNILICLGACLYTVVSILNQKMTSAPADPSRIAAQVVSGVGFLGAGAILRGNGGVIGLTTAATIWVVAAIGVTVGSGYPLFAILVTITTLVVLKMVQPIYNFIEKKFAQETYLLQILGHERTYNSVLTVLFNSFGNDFKIIEECISEDKGTFMYRVYVDSYPKKIDYLMHELKSIVHVKEVNAIQNPMPEDFNKQEIIRLRKKSN
jgi:putative Mg2+ transporter-C (MgtC) family protein